MKNLKTGALYALPLVFAASMADQAKSEPNVQSKPTSPGVIQAIELPKNPLICYSQDKNTLIKADFKDAGAPDQLWIGARKQDKVGYTEIVTMTGQFDEKNTRAAILKACQELPAFGQYNVQETMSHILHEGLIDEDASQKRVPQPISLTK